MARADHEYIFFNQILELLDTADFPSGVITKVFEHIFGKRHPPKPRMISAPNEWDSHLLARMVNLSAEIASKYAQLFYDPRNLPVTHSWRQKQVAIYLDELFCGFLRSAILRSAAKNVLDSLELERPDEFLDKPILFLKEEAREGRFPSIDGRASLESIRDRYFEKLRMKGMRIDELMEQNFRSFDY